jgi:outer membrane receptor protein involved in Fe transport
MRISISRGVAAACAILMAAAAAPAPARAQQQLAAMQGTVTDPTGAVLPGVSVTVTRLETGAARTTMTNERGVYRVQSLDPGRYQVAAELASYRKGVHADVTLSVGATLGLDFKLAPGDVTESVQVAARAIDIQTEKADISAVVEQKKIADLPLVGRNVLALAALQPGVNGIPTRTDFLQPEQGMGITAAGQRESANSATVDGMSINNGPWGGQVLLVPNAEAVQEFQVIANNPSAEFGRNSGAAISIVTKSGTNELRGSGFQFHRDESLRAKNIFETTKPDFSRNDFGVSAGGPIKSDRTFFFGSYEGVRELSGSGELYTVETEQFRDWVMQNRPGSNAAKLLDAYRPSAYPTSGLSDLGSPAPGAGVVSPPDGIPDVGTISLALIGRRTGDQFNGRVDQMFNGGNDRLRGTYYITKLESPFLYVRPAFNHPFPFKNQLLGLAYTKVFSSRMLNELNFGFLRQHGEAGDPTPDAPTISILGGVSGYGVEFWHPITFTQNNVEIRDTLTLNRGRHSFRAGGELRMNRDGATLHHWERPNYEFNSLLDFADGETFSETRAVDPATGQSTVAPGKYATNEWSLFLQDNWKARPNLTVTLGLRYDNYGNPSKADLPFNGIVLGAGATRQEQMAGSQVTTVEQLYGTDWNNFSPRVGASWDPTGAGTWVIRGGAGLAYNRVNNTNFSDERLNPPQFASATASVQNGVPMLYTLGPVYPANPALGRGVDANGGILGARVNLRVIDPELVTPYYYNWFAGVQRQLPWNFVAEADYVGTAGRHLMTGDGPGGEDYNRIAGDLFDGRQDRLNASFGQVGLAESRISSRYHGVTFQVNRRFSGGLAFQTSLTIGKATDTPASSVEVTRPDLERGPASFDIHRKLATNLVWQIPYAPSGKALGYLLGGWQVNAIWIWQTGFPFSVTCEQPYPACDYNADGVTGDRPNASAGGTSLGTVSQQQWLTGVLTAADFGTPAAGTVGTLGRNTYRGPAYSNVDFSLFKNVTLPWFGTRQSTVQLRVEAFNLFNHTNLNNPENAIDSSLFGRVTSVRASRELQLGAKFSF